MISKVLTKANKWSMHFNIIQYWVRMSVKFQIGKIARRLLIVVNERCRATWCASLPVPRLGTHQHVKIFLGFIMEVLMGTRKRVPRNTGKKWKNAFQNKIGRTSKKESLPTAHSLSLFPDVQYLRVRTFLHIAFRLFHVYCNFIRDCIVSHYRCF